MEDSTRDEQRSKPRGIDRRGALVVLCQGVVAGLAACAGGDADAGPTGAAGSDIAGVTITAREIVVRLAEVPTLRPPRGGLVIAQAQAIVLAVGASDYRAYSNICTHSGCGIQLFDGERMRCQCHGSAFDVDGRNVEGPAPSPLPRLALTHDATAGLLRIVRG